jgi:hypothetical protein
MSFCRKCGFELVSDADYSVSCGTTIGAAEKYVKSQNIGPKKQKITTKFIFLLGATFVVGVLFGGYAVGYMLPQLIEARIHSNQKRILNILREFSVDQETYKTENSYYGTIERVSIKGKANLSQSRNGYNFYDLIVTPTPDYWAVVASPVKWGVDGDRHYIISNTGIVREYNEKILPFKVPIFPVYNCLANFEKFNAVQ